jgi:hypothetical protein
MDVNDFSILVDMCKLLTSIVQRTEIVVHNSSNKSISSQTQQRINYF